MLVFLTGIMGSGKTTIGRRLAHQLHAEFIDMDNQIEKEENKSINEIFSSSGEEAFRSLETNLLKSLQALDQDSKITVVSTGGGVVIRDENRKIMNASGTVIYIRAELEDLLNRLENDKSRPLLKDHDLKKRLTGLINSRQKFYKDCTFEVVNKNVDSVVNQILDYIEQKRRP